MTELALARLLRTMTDERLYVNFGYASIRDYAVAALDLEPRRTRELLLLGRRLSDLPAVEAALEAGELSWTKAREIARVATPETEVAWLHRAGEVTSRALEHEVATAKRGAEPPEGPPDVPPGPARRRVVFEMEAEEADLLRAAIARVRSQAGEDVAELGDGAILADQARRVLLSDGDVDASGERYMVLVQHCPQCQQTSGHDSEVRDTLIAEAACDAVQVDLRPGATQGRRTRVIPPRTRRMVLARDHYRCVVPGCSNRLWLDLHHVKHFACGGDHRSENLITLCSAHHRLHHDGRLAIEGVDRQRIRVGFADGRAFMVKLGEKGGKFELIRDGRRRRRARRREAQRGAAKPIGGASSGDPMGDPERMVAASEVGRRGEAERTVVAPHVGRRDKSGPTSSATNVGMTYETERIGALSEVGRRGEAERTGAAPHVGLRGEVKPIVAAPHLGQRGEAKSIVAAPSVGSTDGKAQVGPALRVGGRVDRE